MFLKFDSNFLKHLVDDTLKSTMVLLFYSIRCWAENYIFSRRQKERERERELNNRVCTQIYMETCFWNFNKIFIIKSFDANQGIF